MKSVDGVEAVVDNSARKLRITWPDGDSHAYHFVWLRHHARCPQGMPNDTSVKIDLLPEDPASLQIAGWRNEGDALIVDWRDASLQTRHGLENLRQSAYEDAARIKRKHQPLLWDQQNAASIPRFAFTDLAAESGQLELMLAMRDYGLVRVNGLPTAPGGMRELVAAFGPIHVNNYGEIFDVKSDAKMKLGSNSGHFLPPHTDESYRHEAPGISFFHCLQAAAQGGDSVLVDGFNAAAQLRSEDFESFEVLSSIPVFFQRHAPPQEDMRSHARILVRDVDGDVVGIRWTDRTLPPQDLPEAHVEPVYRALYRLRQIVNREENQYRYRMQPGDLHLFDNHRVLHGRLAFDPSSGARHLQQCSVNRDEFHNNLRSLAAKLDHPARNLIMAGGAVG